MVFVNKIARIVHIYVVGETGVGYEITLHFFFIEHDTFRNCFSKGRISLRVSTRPLPLPPFPFPQQIELRASLERWRVMGLRIESFFFNLVQSV